MAGPADPEVLAFYLGLLHWVRTGEGDLPALAGALGEEAFSVFERDVEGDVAGAPPGIRGLARAERARRGGGPGWAADWFEEGFLVRSLPATGAPGNAN